MPGQAAARNSDMHLCPKPRTPPPTPPPIHGPGKIQAAGAAKVFVNGKAAAVEGDTCQCTAEPGNSVKKGSSTVSIGSKKAARLMDFTSHMVGGSITSGSSNVFIGG